MYKIQNKMVNIKIFDPNKIKIGEKSYKNILINHIEYVTIKDSRCATITSVNPFLYTLLLIKQIDTLKKVMPIDIGS